MSKFAIVSFALFASSSVGGIDPVVSLMVKNKLGGTKSKIADFYQNLSAKEDCEILRREWEKSGYKASCEVTGR